MCLNQQSYGHLPPITKTIKIRQTRHVEHCRKSRNKVVSDVPLWTPSHGRAKAGRSARTYIHQRCADTGCSLEDMPEAMDDREWWRERVRDIRADCDIYIYIYIWSSHCVIAKELDSSHKVNELELQFRSCIHFRTNTLGESMGPLILSVSWQIVSQLLYKDGFGI